MDRQPMCREDAFGPAVEGCDIFDFTFEFENTILCILPSCFLLVIGIIRIFILRGRPACNTASWAAWTKFTVLCMYSGLQLAFLIVLADMQDESHTITALVAGALAWICSIMLCPLSFLEHSKNARPSTIMLLYLLVTTLFNAARIRTLWLISPASKASTMLIITTVLGSLALLLEAGHKSRFAIPYSLPRSTEESSGIFSLSLSLWLRRLFWSSYRKTIGLDHIQQLGSDMNAENLEKSFLKIRSDGDATSSFSGLLFDCMRLLRWQLLGGVPLRLLVLALTVIQPLLLQSLLRYLSRVESSTSIRRALIGAYVLVYFGMALSMNLYWYYHLRVITKLRSVLVTAIGRHTTKVNLQLLEDPKTPVTLMSNDVERAVQGIRYLHEVWANLIQAGLAVFILERQVHTACVVPVSLTLAACGLVVYVTKPIGKKQAEWMEAIQRRIAAVTKTLASLKSMKMKGLERNTSTTITEMRDLDVKSGNSFRRIVAYAGVLSFVPEYLCPFLTFTVLITVPTISGTTFDATKVFTTLAALLVLTQPLTNLFQVMPSLFAGIASIDRIGAFLETEVQSDGRQFTENQDLVPSADEQSEFEQVHSLKSEKSRAVKVDVESKFSEQVNVFEAFSLQRATFGWGQTSSTLLDMTVRVPHSRLTIVIGPVGSGKTTFCESLLGQTHMAGGKLHAHLVSRQIAYCSQVPYLINATIRDNIVMYSAFDTKWYQTVLESTALSRDLQTLPMSDETVIGSNGSKLSGGQRQRLALARALYSRARTVIMDDVFSGFDRNTSDRIFMNLIGPSGIFRQLTATVILVTHQQSFLPSADHIIALDSRGRVIKEGSYDDLTLMAGFQHYAKESLTDKAVDNVADRNDGGSGREPVENNPDSSQTAPAPDSLKIYGTYARASGYLQLLLLVFFSLGAATCASYSTLWLKRWTDHSASPESQRNGFYLGIYALLQSLTLFFLFGVALHSLTNVASRSGKVLHAALLRSTLSAPFAVIASIDSGSITNKFSQDIQLIDSELPMALMNFLLCIATGLGQGIVILIVSPWTGLAYPPLLLLLFAIQKIYLRTSKQIRNLDLEAKSPLYAFFLDIVTGMSTIRAFDWSEIVMSKLQAAVDCSQKPFYILFMVQQWLTLVMEIVIAIVATVVVAVAVSLGTRSSSVGVAILQVMSFSGILRQIVMSWVNMETSIAAISRLIQFSEQTVSEHSKHNRHEPPPGWPVKGEIEFQHMDIAYPSQPHSKVLRDITLKIPAGSKIGVCGPSGGGKSTMALSLFGMVECVSGSLFVDGINLDSLNHDALRTRFTAIPQDAYFPAATIRSNLVPPGLPEPPANDDQLRNVLSLVGLWAIVEKHGGLNSQFKDGMFSHGQTQLFSLACALLRPSKVILLDEFTSSVDVETDVLMQKLVDEVFRSSTVILIAHRLNTIMSCDQIVMLDQGTIIDQGHPKELMKRGLESSPFARFVQGIKAHGSEDASSR